MGVGVNNDTTRFFIGAAFVSACALQLALSRTGWRLDLRPLTQIMAERRDPHLAVGQLLIVSQAGEAMLALYAHVVLFRAGLLACRVLVRDEHERVNVALGRLVFPLDHLPAALSLALALHVDGVAFSDGPAEFLPIMPEGVDRLGLLVASVKRAHALFRSCFFASRSRFLRPIAPDVSFGVDGDLAALLMRGVVGAHALFRSHFGAGRKRGRSPIAPFMGIGVDVNVLDGFTLLGESLVGERCRTVTSELVDTVSISSMPQTVQLRLAVTLVLSGLHSYEASPQTCPVAAAPTRFSVCEGLWAQTRVSSPALVQVGAVVWVHAPHSWAYRSAASVRVSL